jgi:hypothetical protein
VAEQELTGLAVPEGRGRRGCRQSAHDASVCACGARSAGTTLGARRDCSYMRAIAARAQQTSTELVSLKLDNNLDCGFRVFAALL